MRTFKSKSLTPLSTDKDIEKSNERTRFFPYATILECIQQSHPINNGFSVIGYRVTNDGIELIIK
jgi:hypothetical protein